MRLPPLRYPLLSLLLTLAGTLPLSAQMVPGIRLIGEAEELGLDRKQQSRDFKVQEISCNVPANVLWPGDQASLRLRITNLTAAPLTAEGRIEVIQYGTRGRPGNIWEPLFYKIAPVDSIPLQISGLAPQASVEITVEPTIPETFGGYVLVADLGGHGRAFAASLARSIQPDGGAEQFPAYALDLNGSSEEVARFFKRTGVKGARLGLDSFAADDKDYAKKWSAMEKQLQTLKENEVTTMITTGGGGLPFPLGRPRPHLEDDGTFKDTKSDWAWLPSADPEFEAWVAKFCGEFGWPKGPINAIELWNEPWEGISISGWGADMLRFREIYTAMAHGVEKARAEAGVQVLLGGCGSSSNTMDKLFPDGSDTFLKWLDFASIHYQVMSATPALMKDFRARQSPNGPVRVWDTESWIANSEDRIGLVVASMHAMGQERAMGVYAGNVYEPQAVKLEDGSAATVVQAWSPAAALGASTKFVGQRPFQELLFQNGLPWVFVFQGRSGASADDGTVVVAGDLGACYSRTLLLHRGVFGLGNREQVDELSRQIAALPADAPDAARKELATALEAASVLTGSSLTITDGGGQFRLMDFYGNPVPAEGGKIIIPLNGNGYYLRTNGGPGSFARLLDELRKGRTEGYEPVEMIPHDLTARLETRLDLRVTVTNILNRPITGKLSVHRGETALEAGPKLNLAAHETREIAVKTAGLQAVPGNAYPLQLEFDAGADGKAFHEETIHVNVIAKRSIKVDGQLDEWDGVIPQTLTAPGIGANLTEKAWLPFTKFDDSVAQGLSTGYLAYDEQNFYFAARISDSTPDAGMVRFETRDDDQYFYPETALRLDEKATFAKEDKPIGNPDNKQSLRDDGQRLALPDSQERSAIDWESLSTTLAYDVSLPTTEARQVSLYVLSWDPLGRHNLNVEIVDKTTGKVLDRQNIKDFRDGKYLVYHLSGNLRIRIASYNWLKAVLNGVFFDPAPGAKPVSGASAQFVRTDEITSGNWPGAYGADGYEIAGGPARIPAYAQTAFSQEVSKEELQWPTGVRHFSYRKRPDLPGGGPANHDNVQIAFNVLPAAEKPWLPSPPGTPPRWMMYWDTDYEYGFNEVAAQYGGGTELWRLQVPGMPRKHFYPRQPKSPFDGPVKNGQLVMRRDGNTRIVEAALPWTEIPAVKARLDAGQTIKFDFRVNDNGGPSCELATERSVAKANSTTFHNDWQTHWSNELEFAFEK